jgi:hypothetical protein
MAKKFVRFVWYVHRPTCEGVLDPPSSWSLERVVEGGHIDRLLDRGIVSSTGEVIELPGEWHRFSSRASAEAWLRSERWQWGRRNSQNS